MRTIKFLIVALGVALFSVASVGAQTNFGGNNASDYQPPTRNPQSDVATGIQTNNTTIQPTNRGAGVNQQNLPALQDLQVITTTDKGAPSTGNELTKKPSTFLRFFIIDLLAFLILALAFRYWTVRRRKTRTNKTDEKSVEILPKTTVSTKKPKKKKPSPVKRSKNRKKH